MLRIIAINLSAFCCATALALSNVGAAAQTRINLQTQVRGTLPPANGGTGITSLGANVATFLGTPTSANLAAAVTNETGTGSLVFSASPTFTGTISAADGNFSGNVTAANLGTAGTMVNGNLCSIDTSTNPDTINCNAGAPGVPFALATAWAGPTDATTVYFALPGLNILANSAARRIYFNRAGTLTKFRCSVYVAGTLATTEQSTLFFRLNDTTNTNISTVVQFDALQQTYSNTGLAITIADGDFGVIGLTTPTWVTNPTSIGIECTGWIQ